MKFVVNITVSVQSGFTQELATALFNNDFTINSFQLTNKDSLGEVYTANIVYTNQKTFEKTISSLESDHRCLSISVTNRLEEKIKKGLLTTTRTLDFDNNEEYETNHKGAYLLLKSIITKNEHGIGGYKHTTAATLSGVALHENDHTTKKCEYAYIQNEQHAAIITKFTEINAAPLVVTYSLIEDFIRTLQSIAHSYSLFYIDTIPDDDDPDIYATIADALKTPFFSKESLEMPIQILSGLYHCLKRFKLHIDNTSVGFIGLSAGAIVTTRLLEQEKCQRVLGYDHNEKSMLNFESKGGLATTKKNILENCDVVIIIRDQLSEEDMLAIRPGLIIISLVETEIHSLIEKNRSIKFLLNHTLFDSNLIKPGVVQGLINSKKSSVTDQEKREIARLLVKRGDSTKIFPPIFSTIHSEIEEILSTNQKHKTT